MASYSQRDQQMLTEAYTVQLLKESIPDMSLSQVSSNIELMTESEAEYVATVSERIILEFLGLKALGTAAKNAIGGAASGVAQGVRDKAGRVAQGAKQIGSGVAGAAGQLTSNVEDIYQTANQGSKSSDTVKKAIDLTNQLKDMLTQAQQSGILGEIKGDINNMTLGAVVDTLEAVKGSWSDLSQQSQSKGLGGGIKQAYKQGMGSGAKQAFDQGRSSGTMQQLRR